MRSEPIQENINTLLKTGRSVFRKMIKVADTENNKALREAAHAQKSWLDVLYDLHNESGEKQREAYRKAQAYFEQLQKIGFGSEGIDTAQNLLTQEVIKATEHLNTIRNGARASRILPQGHTNIVEAAEKEAGLITRTIGKGVEWHQNTLHSVDQKHPGAGFGIAVAEMVVGGALIDMGGKMLSVSMTGLKERQVETDSNKDGNKSVTFAFEPIPTTERVIKGVIGGGALVAGLAGTVAGFYNIFRSM